MAGTGSTTALAQLRRKQTSAKLGEDTTLGGTTVAQFAKTGEIWIHNRNFADSPDRTHLPMAVGNSHELVLLGARIRDNYTQRIVDPLPTRVICRPTAGQDLAEAVTRTSFKLRSS